MTTSPKPASRNTKELEERLAYSFRHRAHLEVALTHRSFSEESPEKGLEANQRLEFLGDAALGVLVAEWLVLHCPEWQEGTLTKVRSRLTNASTLAAAARRLELGAYLRLGKGEAAGGGRNKDAVLADALEALLGAMWLDGGPGPIRQWLSAHFASELATAVEAGGDVNPKGELQEFLQQQRQPPPRYVLLEESGPAHARRFRVAVYADGEWLAEGQGPSKREAEIQAAAAALGAIRLGAPQRE
ncbi:MAG: ribonuclease III [Verrucomicrobiota bacterium]|jgi:ribonuclease-3|nr:ribonuclease III [Verrucomicrobiota bacterium]